MLNRALVILTVLASGLVAACDSGLHVDGVSNNQRTVARIDLIAEPSPSDAPSVSELPIRFTPMPGWETLASPSRGRTPPTAWMSDSSFWPDERPGVTFPDGTLSQLPDDGVLIIAFEAVPHLKLGNPNFPVRELPLALPDEVESSWEGYVPGRGRSTIRAGVQGRAIQVWALFGTPHPSEETRAAAEAALSGLVIMSQGARQ